jgi:hypothetical protein
MSMALGAVNLHRVRHRAPPPEAITGFDRAYAALLSDLTAGGTA